MRAVLQDVTHRVRSMALVHEKLYQSADLARVEFAEYLRSLLNYLWRAHGTAASGVRLTLDLEPVPLSVNAAVPCGLILNELVSNALKHAFRGRAERRSDRVASRRGAGPGVPVRARQRHGPAGGVRLEAGPLPGSAPGADARRTAPCSTWNWTAEGGTEFKITFWQAESVKDLSDNSYAPRLF